MTMSHGVPPGGEILIVTGPPGAGKSTVSAILATKVDRGVLVDGDTFFQSIRTGWIPPWEPASRAQNEVVIEVIGAAADRYASGGYAVVVDGIIGPWTLAAFTAAAVAPVHYAVLRPSLEVAMSRATKRGEPWLVDPGPISKMYAEFAELREHEAHVIDTTDDSVPMAVAKVLAALGAGRLRLR